MNPALKENPRESIAKIEVDIDDTIEKLATLAEAHREYVGGCLDEDEYEQICDQADMLNMKLDFLNDIKNELNDLINDEVTK